MTLIILKWCTLHDIDALALCAQESIWRLDAQILAELDRMSQRKHKLATSNTFLQGGAWSAILVILRIASVPARPAAVVRPQFPTQCLRMGPRQDALGFESPEAHLRPKFEVRNDEIFAFCKNMQMIEFMQMCARKFSKRTHAHKELSIASASNKSGCTDNELFKVVMATKTSRPEKIEMPRFSVAMCPFGVVMTI